MKSHASKLDSSMAISLGDYQWEFRQASGDGVFLSATTFPTVVHHELLKSNRIKSPDVGLNEREIQWVGQEDWIFRTAFPTPTSASQYASQQLAFDGLDTYATVLLNQKEILKSDNMFVPHRIDVKNTLRPPGQLNELEIYFKSAWNQGKALEREHGKEHSGMRDSSRLQVRKAQFHWGWDWGPIMVTAGPYNDICLELNNGRIADVFCECVPHSPYNSAEIKVHITLETENAGFDVSVEIHEPSESKEVVAHVQRSRIENNFGVITLDVQKPDLWWPNGHGGQPLYTVSVKLLGSEGSILDVHQHRFGIRRVELVQKPLLNQPGTSFFFRINNRSIFAAGTNWIPAHNLTTAVTREVYRKWILLAVRGNQNMIRVWGGGLYEDDEFYDACDELGILIWHDFMFACGGPPVRQDLLDSITLEAEAQVTRLRRHPCMALWCGNNEDYMLADQRNLDYDPNDMVGPYEDSPFPARKIYNHLLPSVVKKLDPHIPYHPSSPFGGKTGNDPTVGDLHQWDVYHGEQKPYQNYPSMGGRFVSEFGMHAFPDIRTVKQFAPNPADQYPQSRVMDCHNKGAGAERRLGTYLSENFRYKDTNLENYIYLTQLLQSEALGYALRGWRRDWGPEGERNCGGALIWQLNDCYPTTSWSIVDSNFRPKASYWTTKRDFAPITVTISRDPVSLYVDENEPRDSYIPKFEVFGASSVTEPKPATLEVEIYDFGKMKSIQKSRSEVIVKPNQSILFGSFPSPEGSAEGDFLIMAARLLDRETGHTFARFVNWPEPYRYLLFPRDVKLDIHVRAGKAASEATDIVTLTTDRPLKGVFLHVAEEDGEEPDWDDNMVDLMPDELIEITVRGLAGRKIRARWLGCWE